MANVGWEVRPAGWILLIAVAVVVIYLIVRRSQADSGRNPQ